MPSIIEAVNRKNKENLTRYHQVINQAEKQLELYQSLSFLSEASTFLSDSNELKGKIYLYRMFNIKVPPSVVLGPPSQTVESQPLDIHSLVTHALRCQFHTFRNVTCVNDSRQYVQKLNAHSYKVSYGNKDQEHYAFTMGSHLAHIDVFLRADTRRTALSIHAVGTNGLGYISQALLLSEHFTPQEAFATLWESPHEDYQGIPCVPLKTLIPGYITQTWFGDDRHFSKFRFETNL